MDFYKAKMLTVIIAIALIVGVAAGVCVTKMTKKHSGGKTEPNAMVSLAEMVVNLADNKEQHYLKTKVVLEVNGANAEAEMEQRMPKVRDSVIAALSSCYFRELLTPDGKKRLKESVKFAVNEHLRGSKVVSVYFSDFAMQ